MPEFGSLEHLELRMWANCHRNWFV